MSAGEDVERGLRDLLRAFGHLDTASCSALDMGSNELVVLRLITDGMHAPSELSRAIGMTTAGMTNLLDRMEADGYVRRDRHERDGRRIIVTLTKRGLQSQLHFTECLEAMGRIAENDGSPQTVVTFLRRAADVVEERARSVASAS